LHTPLADAASVTKLLGKALGGYSKLRLNQDHFPIKLVPDAFRRAQKLTDMAKGGYNPTSNMTAVYKIWKEIVENSLLSQLPDELKNIKK